MTLFSTGFACDLGGGGSATAFFSVFGDSGVVAGGAVVSWGAVFKDTMLTLITDCAGGVSRCKLGVNAITAKKMM